MGLVSIGGNPPDVIRVQATTLDWTVAPRFELGYRLPRGLGEVLLSYRFITTEGQQDSFNDQGSTHLKSRLNVNVLDVDFANRDPLWDHWEMRWRVGVRVAGVFFDASSDQRGVGDNAGSVLGQKASNNFVGAGPHAGLELWRRLPFAGLSLYGEIEAASIWGHLQQSFEETLAASGAPTLGGATLYPTTQGVAMLGAQLGLSWTPPGYSALRLSFGYQFEQWFQVGRNDNNGSKGDLTEHGLFFRGEITY
jgi:hypothetical protein